MKRFGLVVVAGLLIGGTAAAHDEKDPVCRMTVDSDTSANREEVAGQTYYFCSAACQKRFRESPRSFITLASELTQGKRRSYRMALGALAATGPDRPLPLELTVVYGDTGDIVRKFEVIHEKLLHLVMVSDDLSWFQHEHPELGRDGRFRLSWRFPRAGRYLLFSDFTPVDGDNQITRTELVVGPPGSPAATGRLVADARLKQRVMNHDVHLRIAPAVVRAGEPALLTYAIADAAGKPVTDMEPYLAAMGHLFAISSDGETVIHTHTVRGVAPGSYEAAMLAMMQAGHDLVVTPEMASPRGPTFTFKPTFPRPGTYKVWAQFARQGRVLTVPFVVAVAAAETPAEKPPAKR